MTCILHSKVKENSEVDGVFYENDVIILEDSSDSDFARSG